MRGLMEECPSDDRTLPQSADADSPLWEGAKVENGRKLQNALRQKGRRAIWRVRCWRNAECIIRNYTFCILHFAF